MNINRRDAILVPLAVGAIGVQFPLLAQAPRAASARTIGYFELGADPKIPEAERPLTVALRKLGWILGENLRIERRYAELKHERLAIFAEELVRKQVDLIYVQGPPAAVAAARATRTIPIVFNPLGWPVELGLIDSLARPGRNLTGAALFSGVEVTTKRLEFLREVAPKARRLSWLWAEGNTETVAGSQFDAAAVVESAAKRLNFEARFHLIHQMEDIETALGEATRWGAQALCGASSLELFLARQRIAEFALHHRLPSAFFHRTNVEAGGLLSYAAPPAELMRLALRNFEYIDRILRGARPADLPVEQPNTYELVINLKTAKALGLTVPRSVLLRADEVIQ